MKKLNLNLFLLVLGLVTTAVIGGAHGPAKDHHHDEMPEWADVFHGASLPVVWHSARVANERIAAALDAKRLDGVGDWAETIHLAAHALMDQVQLPSPDQKQRLDAALRQAAKIADDVLDGAHHDDHRAAAAAYRRLASTLSLINRRLPKEITEKNVAEEELRVATAKEHGHEH
jgi:hypothetical protein